MVTLGYLAVFTNTHTNTFNTIYTNKRTHRINNNNNKYTVDCILFNFFHTSFSFVVDDDVSPSPLHRMQCGFTLATLAATTFAATVTTVVAYFV